MGKSAVVLALGLVLLTTIAAGPPVPSKLAEFGAASLGTARDKLPAALQPSKSCLSDQAKTNKPCEVVDGAGVTYLVFDDHLSAKEIRRADPLAALPYGFSWSDSIADGQRKMHAQFHLKQFKVQTSANGTVIDTGACFLDQRGGNYFRFYLKYDAQAQLKALGVALCVYL